MDKHRARLILYAALSLAVMVGIFILSSQNAEISAGLSESFLGTIIGRLLAAALPKLTEKGIFNDIRKYAHIFEFFCLGMTSCLFFTELKTPRILRGALYSVAFSVFYACTDEFHQLFVPGRSGEVKDILIDTSGIVFGVMLTTLIVRIGKKKKKQ